jgi:hypothetical protein
MRFSLNSSRFSPVVYGCVAEPLKPFGLYAARSDKSYSLTDCVSMQTMRRQGLTDILTNYRHFEQEGFELCSGIERAFDLMLQNEL